MAAGTIENVCLRPDDMTELVSLYWKGGRRPLTKQMKFGLAAAFKKFSEYSLAKYDRAGAVKRRDDPPSCRMSSVQSATRSSGATTNAPPNPALQPCAF